VKRSEAIGPIELRKDDSGACVVVLVDCCCVKQCVAAEGQYIGALEGEKVTKIHSCDERASRPFASHTKINRGIKHPICIILISWESAPVHDDASQNYAQ
jgi:hypothetical protein